VELEIVNRLRLCLHFLNYGYVFRFLIIVQTVVLGRERVKCKKWSRFDDWAGTRLPVGELFSHH
jgi:hypothetical protein